MSGALLLLVVFAIAWWLPPSTTVHVEATTETAELVTLKDAKSPRDRSRPMQWGLGKADAEGCVGDSGAPGKVALGEDDTLVILPGAHVVLQRLEGSPLLRILVEAADLEAGAAPSDALAPPNRCGKALPVRRLRTDGSSIWFHGDRLVVLKEFQAKPNLPWTEPALVLPVDARVSVGQEVGDGGSAMLISGNASIHAAHDSPGWIVHLLHLANRRQTYIAEQLALQRGDRVVLPAEGVAKGYVRVPAVGAMQLASFGSGERAVVMRAGNARVEIEQSIWYRVENEPAIGGVLAALGLWIAMLEVWVSLHELKPHEATGHLRDEARGHEHHA